jgi:16S rRNA A1518/A1519 N6-dimethyltransferase RsmA/KsgA/DIM1 with predicted DNA glycosylase/AP lyase activity
MHNREKAIKLLQDIDIPLSMRPEQISIDQYVTLLNYLQNDK